MKPDRKKPRPEREETDASLRSERRNSDRALVERLADVQESADESVERARERADAVLVTARDKTDDQRDEGEGGTTRAKAKERAREDRTIEDERAAADEALRREREEYAQTLAALLPLVREKTDRHLLTERVRSDVALANRDDFTGMVSHDLRNLLSGIVLSARLLTEQASETDEGRRTVVGMKRIQRYAAHMHRLIGDLVDIVSIDAGQFGVVRERCDVGALLAEAVDAFAPAAKEQGTALSLEPVEDGLAADLDRVRMLQVLANLIGNALKFTPRGGEVVVRAGRAEDELRLSVEDTGVGIPDGMLEAVFERFRQVGKDDTRGLGLGLYISRCIVTAHGGQIRAESTLGAGSAFHVAIPGAVVGRA